MDPTMIRAVTLRVPSSRLGAEDRVPHVVPIRVLPEPVPSVAVDDAMLTRWHRGRPATDLPYARLSDYDRSRDLREIPAIELVGERARVLVLPTLGGRVWSFEADGRELLHRNEVLQFANFGLSDAWFAGGIEWNLGSTGHTSLTARPVHAARVSTPEGDVLRLWEWERSRDLVMQLDLRLDGPRLVASTRVLNPDPEDKPLYWWTNIAVPETDGTRVVSPAMRAWRTTYDGQLELVDFPHPDGPADASRPATSTHAADYFFDVADQDLRFVAAIQAHGRGLAQSGTRELAGRKLFVWGDGPGGRRWQQWLSEDARYCEIQAGVCPTQLEHDVVAGHGERSWTEVFGPVEADPESEYAALVRSVGEQLEPAAGLEERHRRWLTEIADVEPDPDRWCHGSGWGHVESEVRDGWSHPAVPFARRDDASEVALSVLREGAPTDPARLPVPPVSVRWRALWDRVTPHWWTDAARGLALELAGDEEAARAAYNRSVAADPQVVALVGLARLASRSGEIAVAEQHYRAALDLSPLRSVATELLTLLLASGRAVEALDLEASLPDGVRRHGRTQLLRARALALTGQRDEARSLMQDLVVPDLAEGSTEIEETWALVAPGESLPSHLNFRMIREETHDQAT